MTSKLTAIDFQTAAKRLGVEVSAIRAVTEIESLGGGFLSTGQIKILYERHILYRFMSQRAKSEKSSVQRKTALSNLDMWVHSKPNLINPSTGGYATGETADIRGITEHERLKAARKIDNLFALQSASWGMFQIMGFHWQALGYESPVDFVLKLSASEQNQLDAFCRFILNNKQLHNALKAKDWVLFALLYNGRDYKKNHYDTRLAAADKKWMKAA